MHTINTGIWLDFREAYIVSVDSNWQTETRHLRSDVEHHAVNGGSRSDSAWGPQFSPGDKNSLERDKHSEENYFEAVIAAIDPMTEKIAIFGPAEAKTGLKKAIAAIKHFKPQVVAVLPSDYITPNEIAALVIDFFKNPGEYVPKERED